MMNSRKLHSFQFVLLLTFLAAVRLDAQPAKPSTATKHSFQSECLVAVDAQPAKPSTATKHSLWKVQGKENAVYLLGSVHVLKKEDYPLPAPIEGAFGDSKIAVFETDIAGMENPELAMKL